MAGPSRQEEAQTGLERAYAWMSGQAMELGWTGVDATSCWQVRRHVGVFGKPRASFLKKRKLLYAHINVLVHT